MARRMLAVAIGWELRDIVITGSQAAIGRNKSLQSEHPRGWIEERVVAAGGGGDKRIVWVKGCS